MKKAFLIVLALACSHFLFAQQPQQPTQTTATVPQDQAPYLKYPTVPPFHLLKLDSVIASPHMAGVTAEAVQAMAVMTARNILSVLDGNPTRENVINKDVL